MKRHLFLIVCFLSAHSAWSQKTFIDSLEQKLPVLSNGQKASALYEIVNFYLRSDRAKAITFLNDLRSLNKNSADKQVTIYHFLTEGLYLSRQSRLDSAIELYTLAKQQADSLKDYRALAQIYQAMSYAYISSAEAERGLEYLFMALKLNDDHLQDKRIELKIRTNIGWAYLELKQYQNCVHVGRETILKTKGTSFEWIATYTYNNVAASFSSLKQYDSAQFYARKGIETGKRYNDNQIVANGYFILGKTYEETGRLAEAIQQYIAARPYREKVGNPYFIASDLYTLSELYYKSGDYKKGIAAGKEALAIAEEMNLTLKLEGAYLSLAKNYEGLRDFQSSNKYYQLHAAARDSVYKKSSAEAIAEMQTKYESEKKVQQFQLQEAQLARQKAELRITYFVIAALAALLLMTSLIFFLLRSRMKRKQVILEKERQLYLREVEMQASVQSQERERKRFARDLHDSMGQLISALRLALHSVNRESTLEERVQMVDKGEVILNEMYREIRSVAFNLMPQTLVQQGLVPALKEMAERINGMGKIDVKVASLDMPERLNELQEISLFRVIQEWVNNVLKYANASSVLIQTINHDGEIHVMIEDNGIGFDTAILSSSSGNGWKNIKSRINLIKGTIEIDSRANYKGTLLTVKVPLSVDKPADRTTSTIIISKN